MMNVLIIEDEAVIARRLQRLLGDCLDGSTVQIAESLEQARAVPAENIDLVLLDLNLDGQDGYALLRESLSRRYHTVVVSAHTERAVEAFELGVLDFVPKPFTAARLQQAVSRARQALPAPGRMRTLFVRTRRGLESVDVDQITAIEAAADYSELQLTDGRRLLHDKSLTALERLLPETFLRVHRAHIANMRFFMRTRENSEIELAGGIVLPVSRRRCARVHRWLRLAASGQERR